MNYHLPFLTLGIFLSLGTLGFLMLPKETKPPVPQAGTYNVLFISVDDLNHWIGYTGRNPQTQTPNLDRLSSKGMSFSNAHCPAPLCCPSRAALLSGLRPSTSGVYNNGDDWRKVIPDSITMPTFFRRNGFEVVGGGKIYHGGFDRDSEFDYYYREGKDRSGQNLIKKGQFGGIRWAQMEAGDEALNDFHTASWAIKELEKPHDKTFFIACGIFRPHMPWNVPQKYFDQFPLDQIVLPPYKPDDLNDIPLPGKRIADNGDHKALMKTGNPVALWKEAIQAYLASIAFADAQIGRVLDALEKSSYRENTIVVLWGDHGWHLGEKDHWRKFSLWEEATRSPLIWYVPGMTKPGSICDRSVDFMSIYPTLADLCGLPIPNHIEGPSIRSLLENPASSWKNPALTTFNFNNHSVRSDEWRYIRYNDGSEELYNEKTDPYEWTNLADNPKYKSVKKKLNKFLPKYNNGITIGNDTGQRMEN
ncbi:MAG: sulfatase [Haliscomenobacter sp.]|nr:sulfatase [Haliscomenobacter sp.]